MLEIPSNPLKTRIVTYNQKKTLNHKIEGIVRLLGDDVIIQM